MFSPYEEYLINEATNLFWNTLKKEQGNVYSTGHILVSNERFEQLKRKLMENE